jgi:hypothetical protein
MRFTLLAAVAVGLLAHVGCSSGPAALDQAIRDYDNEHYDVAFTNASQAHPHLHGTDRDQAAYVAGLSAYRLDDLSEAEEYLRLAAASSDPTTAARARGMLGEILMERRRPAEAAVAFGAAADGLHGNDARLAAQRAARAYEAARDPAAAARWRERADGIANERTVDGCADCARFSLQVGAFLSQDRARAAADDAERAAKRLTLGAARITPRREAGRTLHVVQIGQFQSRKAAQHARQVLGRYEYIVVSAAGAPAVASR